MSNVKRKKPTRLLAALLAMMMVLSLLPSNVGIVVAATEEHPNAVTITVKDEKGNAIEGAEVECKINLIVEDTSYTQKLSTDENGVVEVMEANDFEVGKYEISANITTSEYEGTLETVAIESAEDNFEVVLERKKALTANTGLVYNRSEQELVTLNIPFQEDDEVTWMVDDQAVTENWKVSNRDIKNNITNIPKKTEAGEYRVTLIVKRENEEINETVKTEISKAKIEGISITNKELCYDGTEQELVTLEGEFEEQDTITWEVIKDETETERKLSENNIPVATEVGTYKVTFTVERGSNYKYEATVETIISKGTIDKGIEITSNELSYNGQMQEALTINNKSGYGLWYQISDETPQEDNWKEITQAEKPMVQDAGNYKIWIKITKENYVDSTQFYDVEVKKGDRTLEFKKEKYNRENSGTINFIGFGPYNKITFDFSASCDLISDDEKIEYSITCTKDGIAKIDEDTGVLSELSCPGKITVQAKLSDNDNYNESTIEYTLIVRANKKDNGDFIKFENDEDETYVLGTNEGVISERQAQKCNPYIDGEIKYSIEQADNNISKAVAINSKTGEVSVNNYNALAELMSANDGALNIIVCASKESGKYWDTDEVSYKVSIVFAETPENPYTLPDTVGDNGWYKSKVVLTPAEGYLISKSAEGFDSTTTFQDQGDHRRYVYLKNIETGAITDKVPVDIKIDSEDPSIEKIEYAKSPQDNFWETITLGFYQSSVTVRLTAQDATSGIASFTCTYTREEGVKSEGYHEEEKIEIIDQVSEQLKGTYVAEFTLTAAEQKQYRGHLSVVATDNAGNSSEEKNDTNNVFVVDNVAPELLNVEYSVGAKGSLGEQDADIEQYVDEIRNIDDIHYYDQKVEVKFTIKEANFYSEDVEVKVQKDNQDLTSDDNDEIEIIWETSEDQDEHQDEHIGSFSLEGDGSYTVSIEYKDKSGNEMKSYTSETIVVDTTAPVFEDLTTREENYKQYYNEDVVLKFKITEANFYKEDVSVTVKKDGNSYDYSKLEWEEKKDDNEIIGKITLEAPDDHTGDGEYSISIEYSDPSGNAMQTESGEECGFKPITIDTTAPVIAVKYTNKNVINTLEDSENHSRKYFDDKQTATVTITERNFDAAKVDITILAKDVVGNEIELGETSLEWTSDGDDHTAEITYDVDANYTFDISCMDKADNKSEDYEKDYFTVDRNAPTNLQIYYSNSVLETILESISFGFYNAKVTVTLVAEDITSEINSIVYSYVKAKGVSSVNAEKKNQTITANSIQYDGKTAKAVFEIPKDTLNSSNQFNGTVEFKAVDRAGNTSELKGTKRIVVDTIAPTATVSYNNAVNVVGDVSYYDGDIQATVTINEANFYASDVNVMVSKDGGTPTAVSTNWNDTNVDTHVGTFTITGDGDYVVTIDYTDKSMNKMTSYSSNKMTIDTKIEEPTYTINGEAKSEVGGAYKGDMVVGFEYADQNYDTASIKLTRTRFDKVEDVTKDFVQVSENDNGGSGRFAIPTNVENDGIYVLTIGMTDKAKHSAESKITFTVNRYGSVYEYSDELVSLIQDGGQYVKSVEDDLVITEYNADEILEGSLQLLVTRDGENVEVDYENNRVNTPNQNTSEGWYQYTYTIKAENFEEDGVYKISLASAYATTDSATNDSTSVPENSVDENGNKILDTMSFTVDSVAPEIRNVINLDQKIADIDKIENGKLPVKYTIVDVGGLKNIEIIVNDKTIQTLDEEDFANNIYSYTGTFEIEEQDGMDAQKVRIIATDFAGNVTDTDSEEFLAAHSANNANSTFVFMNEVTISRNFFVRWVANKPLFWGTIGGIIVLIGAAGIFVVFRKKKKEN